jgi:hypothetical protein
MIFESRRWADGPTRRQRGGPKTRAGARMPLLVPVQIKQGLAIDYTQITTASVTPESISSSSFAMARFRR